MRSKVWAVVAVVSVAGGVLVPSGSAGAVTGAFDATCVTVGAGPVPIVSVETIAFSAHAPDTVAVGDGMSLPVSVGYHVPDAVPGGGLFIDGFADFDVVGATPAAATVGAPAGADSVDASLSLTAVGSPGTAVDVRLRSVGAVGEIGGHALQQTCTPEHRLVVARVGIGVPLVSIGDGAVVEGSTGTRGLQLAVTLSRPASTDVTVPFTVEAGTATAGSDYTTESGTATIHAGFVSGIATVRVRGDSIVEPKENLRVRLHDAVGAVIGRRVGTGRIIDDDPERGTRISIGDASVVEGNRAVRSMRFMVSLSQPATDEHLFHYRTVDGTAVAAAADYRRQEFDFFVPAGHSSVTVPVPVPADATPEPTKSFVVALSPPTGSGAGRDDRSVEGRGHDHRRRLTRPENVVAPSGPTARPRTPSRATPRPGWRAQNRRCRSFRARVGQEPGAHRRGDHAHLAVPGHRTANRGAPAGPKVPNPGQRLANDAASSALGRA